MNKKQLMEKLNEKLNLNEESLSIFSKIVEDVPIIGKTNKEKMVKTFIEKLNVNQETAEHYYEVFSEVFATALKDKLKHPFN